MELKQISQRCVNAFTNFQAFIASHENMRKYMRIHLLGLYQRMAVLPDRSNRIIHLNQFIDAARTALDDYRSTHNQYLRDYRRSIKFIFDIECHHDDERNREYTKYCIRKLRDVVLQLHDDVSKIIDDVIAKISVDNNDDGILTPLLNKLTSISKQYGDSRRDYIRAYTSMNFLYVLLDKHFLLVMIVKTFKAVLIHMAIKIAKSWFDTNVHAKYLSGDNFIPFARVLSAVIVGIDACIVCIMLAISKAIHFLTESSTIRAETRVWWSMLKDSLVGNSLSISFMFVFAKLFKEKRYLRIREDPVVSFDSYLTIVSRILLINCFVPYYLVV